MKKRNKSRKKVEVDDMAVKRENLAKNLACFTIAQDESIGLKMWIAHYKTYAPTATLYVLNHDSRGSYQYDMDDLVAKHGIIAIPVHHAFSSDYAWLTDTVERFMRFLLASHSAVCFSEIDELVFPVDGTIEDVVKKRDNVFFRASGYGVVHKHPDEPDLNWHAPLLRQRQQWYRTQRYSKICVARKPVFFKYGFHEATNVPESLPTLDDLLLLHLHQIDYKTTLRRHQSNAGRFWSPRFRLDSLSLHQRLDNPPDLERYLLCNIDNPTEYAALEPIPAEYKERYSACVPKV